MGSPMDDQYGLIVLQCNNFIIFNPVISTTKDARLVLLHVYTQYLHIRQTAVVRTYSVRIQYVYVGLKAHFDFARSQKLCL